MKDVQVFPTSIKAKSYSGNEINFRGEVTLKLNVDNNICNHKFYVMKASSVSLMGRDLCRKLNIHLTTYANSKSINSLHNSVLDNYKDYLSPNFKSNVKQKVSINVKPNSKPIFCKSRSVPLRLQRQVKQEIVKLEKEGTITKVFESNWASPSVNVLKDDNSVRICGDYSVTVNKNTDVVQYPLPSIDDVIARVGKAKVFSKIDCVKAYLQLPLDEASKELTTINTSEGLYQYNFLPFGFSSSPAIFQSFMCKVLNGIENIVIYQDDILILTPTIEEHNVILDKVLSALMNAGIKVNCKKCSFYTDRVTYLGHIFDSRGVHPNPDKIRAILNAPSPENLKQLQSFIGLANVYSRFIPRFSTIMGPLYKLLQKNAKYTWGTDQENAFNKMKEVFKNNNSLRLFDCSLDTMLETDASSYGIAGVLMQRVNENSPWYPVQFVSRSLNKAEKNSYSNIEREGLSIVFGCEKFRKFLLGREFLIHNDQKPLQKLFGSASPVPTNCSSRIQRWALRLSQFQYIIAYRKGSDNVHSDFLSRMPLPETVAETEPYELIFAINTLNDMPITCWDIQKYTDSDKDLSELKTYIRSGFPAQLQNPNLKCYKNMFGELTLMKGCIMYCNRVVIPKILREQVLHQFHEGHPGICAMKSMVRSTIWYPAIDSDISDFVKKCSICQLNLSKPSQRQSVEWPRPQRAWSRLHIDHFFIENKICFIVVDAFSKYVECEIVKDTSVAETIDTLRLIFSRHGLCDTIVSDNASCFTAASFKDFLYNNGIQHITSPPYSPSSNGQAERGVRVMKDLLKKNSVGTLKTRLAKVLLFYRSVPHTATKIAPCISLNNRRYISLKDKLNPKYNVCDNLSKVKDINQFNIGDTVLALNLREGPKWYQATIVEKLAINVYNVHIHKLDTIWKRHLHQLRLIPDDISCNDNVTKIPVNPSHTSQLQVTPIFNYNNVSQPSYTNNQSTTVNDNAHHNHNHSQNNNVNVNPTNNELNYSGGNVNTPIVNTPMRNTELPRRSTRLKKPVERFGW